MENSYFDLIDLKLIPNTFSISSLFHCELDYSEQGKRCLKKYTLHLDMVQINTDPIIAIVLDVLQEICHKDIIID